MRGHVGIHQSVRVCCVDGCRVYASRSEATTHHGVPPHIALSLPLCAHTAPSQPLRTQAAVQGHAARYAGAGAHASVDMSAQPTHASLSGPTVVGVVMVRGRVRAHSAAIALASRSVTGADFEGALNLCHLELRCIIRKGAYGCVRMVKH